MTTIKAFIKRHPMLTYFALVFAISWGGVLIVVGPSGIPATNKEQFDTLFPIAILAMVAGPSVAGILLTGLLYGRAGLRAFGSRLLRWRVGARWYAVALLTAPLVFTAVLLTLSLTSSEYLPGILTSDDKASVVLMGIFAGLMAGIFEELGWTGFAIPTLLRLRYGVLATGLIVGLPWAVWHLLVTLPTSTSSLSRTEPEAQCLDEAPVVLLREQKRHRHRHDRIAQSPHAERRDRYEEDDAPDQPPLRVVALAQHQERDDDLKRRYGQNEQRRGERDEVGKHPPIKRDKRAFAQPYVGVGIDEDRNDVDPYSHRQEEDADEDTSCVRPNQAEGENQKA
jgi:membrane protease YdiL (CAAX protease family)